MNPQRVLILGAGVVGQVFGGMLHRAGHLVTFYTRPERVESLSSTGIRLRFRRGRGDVHMTGLRVTDDILLFDEYDLVLVCFRGDQASAAEDLLRRRPVGPAQIAWCMSLWPHRAQALAERIPRSHLLFPGISAVQRADHTEVAVRKTLLCPLGRSASADSARMAEMLTHAGIPARVQPDLVMQLGGMLSIAFPLLLGLAAEGFDLGRLRRNNGRLRLVHQAQQEALTLVEASSGARLSASFRAYRALPAGWFVFGFRSVSPLFPKFTKDMLTHHFRKTRLQQIEMLRDLCSSAPASNHGALDRLLAAAETVSA